MGRVSVVHEEEAAEPSNPTARAVSTTALYPQNGYDGNSVPCLPTTEHFP